MALIPHNYISLAEATKYCHYSQEYLSLRARQRKLKAIKIGRNWTTKKEWLEEYLKNIEVYNNNLKAKKIVALLEGINRAQAEIRETEQHFHVAFRKQYLTREKLEALLANYDECSKILKGLEKSLAKYT